MDRLLQHIDMSCFKTSMEHFKEIKDDTQLINTTTLYGLYVMYTDKPMTIQEFYNKIKYMFYYDIFECEHGTEFYYYIKFKDIDIQDNLPTDIINKKEYIKEI